MKEKLKKCRIILRVYVTIMGPIHRFQFRLCKWLRGGTIEKTRVKYGKKNKNKVFYIATSDNVQCGIFSLLLAYVFPELAFCEKKGYIPYINLQNEFYFSLIQDEKDFGKENPWDYYFEQPIPQLTRREVYQSAKVELWHGGKSGYRWMDWKDELISEEKLHYWNSILRKYIRPSEEIKQKVLEEQTKLFSSGKKVLGVSIRSGYRWGGMSQNQSPLLDKDLYKKHPIVMDTEWYIKRIETLLNDWGYDVFLLCCDDREYVNTIKNYFGDRCVHMERPLSHMFSEGMPVPLEQIDYINHEFKGVSTRESTCMYIAETYLLAECDSLFAVRSGSSVFARIVNGGHYKNVEIAEVGEY